MPTFLKKLISCARRAGSANSQYRCVVAVAAMTKAINNSADRRGAKPRIKAMGTSTSMATAAAAHAVPPNGKA